MAQLQFEAQLKPVWYAIEKVGDWARQSGSGQYFGTTPIEEIREALDNFKKEISKTGRHPDHDPPGIAGEFPEICYVLDQLEAFISGKQADISTRAAAGVFQGWLSYAMDHMREMAVEMDQEYGE
jgi:hypothetical protein